MEHRLIIPIINATSFKSRLIGLIGKKNINYGMFFKNCNSIHTFFMKENIDVIGLDEDQDVIFIEKNVKPNKVIIIHKDIKNTSILELPKNTSNNFKIGDKLFFKFKDVI